MTEKLVTLLHIILKKIHLVDVRVEGIVVVKLVAFVLKLLI